jgi:hypothetical protein
MIVGQTWELLPRRRQIARYAPVCRPRFLGVSEIVGQPRRYLPPVAHDH